MPLENETRKRVKLASKMDPERPKASLESLPDELVLKIVQMASVSEKSQEYCFWTRSSTKSTLCPGCQRGTCAYDHDFLANVVGEISTKFNRIVRDPSLWKDDKTMMPYIRHGSASISSLPDNLILKIVKIAACYYYSETIYMDHLKQYPFVIEYDHDFIASTVASISKRFARIASHSDLWKGNVIINDFEEIERNVFPNDATESFCFQEFFPSVREDDIELVLDKCTNLKTLAFYQVGLKAWPDLALTWNPLQELFLASCKIDALMFKNVNLSVNMPNLKVFILCLNMQQIEEAYFSSNDSMTYVEDGETCRTYGSEGYGTYKMPSILLPDISECKKLQILKIANGYFSFPLNVEGKYPLPNNLEKLILDDIQINDWQLGDRNPMQSLTSMCPNLKMLAYKTKDHDWHSSTPSWPLLEELYLDYQARASKEEDPFYKVELHRCLPNLKILYLTNGYRRSVLPDMRGCEKLEHVHISMGSFVTIDPRVEMPFPKTLKKLTVLTNWSSCFEYENDQVDSDSEPEFVKIFKIDVPKIIEFVKKQMPECEVDQTMDFWQIRYSQNDTQKST